MEGIVNFKRMKHTCSHFRQCKGLYSLRSHLSSISLSHPCSLEWQCKGLYSFRSHLSSIFVSYPCSLKLISFSSVFLLQQIKILYVMIYLSNVRILRHSPTLALLQSHTSQHHARFCTRQRTLYCVSTFNFPAHHKSLLLQSTYFCSSQKQLYVRTRYYF